jgi:hypothetical protein
MPTLTDVAANAALDAMGPLFAKAHIGDPTNAGTAAPSVGLPQRVAVTLGAAAARARTSTADVAWPNPATVAETITHVSLWDSAGAGTCRWRGPLTAPVAVPLNNLFRLPSGQLTISID